VSEFTIFVTITVKPGCRDKVLSLLKENARGARADEPGCRTFDVLVSPEDPDILHAYEVYDDEAAFQAHRDSPHFQAWSAASGDMIDGRNVVRAGRVDIHS